MNFGQSNMHIQGPQINQFNNISPQPIPRSAFKRDFTRRSTFNQDYLIPIFVDEILPGDAVNLKMTAFVRMSTPIKPLMDNLYLDTFWFFVPNRLVWTNWEKFQGQQTNPGDSVAYTIPKLDKTKAPLSTTGFAVQSVYDYLGLPTLVTGLDNISALYNRGLDSIYNDWFRDENLQNSLVIPSGDGPDDPAIYSLRKRNKRKDYITSCLPWPQKGSAVTIGLAGLAPVWGSTSTLPSALGLQNNSPIWAAFTDRTTDGIGQGVLAMNMSTGIAPLTNSAGGDGIGWRAATFGGSGNVQSSTPADLVFLNETLSKNFRGSATAPFQADLAQASGITINALRQAALYQQILELDARGGTRYVESIYSRFGVVSPDFRLQRPELVGQGSTRINIYAVPQTAPTVAGQTPQGNLAAFGTAVVENHGCRYSATEHGMLIGIANVRADLTYQQGIPRMFTRSTRLDFYEPLLNGLGEQAVLNREIYAQGTSADTDPFGYNERFSEYRFKNSEVTGKFRSTDPTTLDVWHLAQKFGSLPALNSSFIEENVPMSRVLAVNTEPSFLFDASYNYLHVRPMPIRSNPGIDRL